MQAVVLVGGEGTRLRPLTYGTPKPMVPIFGVPFLERTLLRLKAAGVDDVILPAGYLPKTITSYFGDGARLGMKLTYVIEDTPLGTAGAIKNVAQYITGPFFVLNGDVLTSLDLRAMIATHEEKGGVGLLHLIRVEDPSAFGCVVHDRSGRISAFVEKPARDAAPTNEINAGTYLLDPKILDRIPVGRPSSIERETFPDAIAAGEPLYAFTTDDYWMDLGRPEHYHQAHRDVLDGKLSLGVPIESEGAAGSPPFTPPSFVSRRGAHVEPGAIVGPYAVIGDRTRIGSGSRIVDSILWTGVIVEPGATVEGAIVADNVRIGRGARIEAGAVIGHDVEIPPGATIPGDARISTQPTAVPK